MAYSKNDIVQVTIEDIGVTGEGIGKIDGYTLFVKDTVIGDVVEVKCPKFFLTSICKCHCNIGTVFSFIKFS